MRCLTKVKAKYIYIKYITLIYSQKRLTNCPNSFPLTRVIVCEHTSVCLQPSTKRNQFRYEFRALNYFRVVLFLPLASECFGEDSFVFEFNILFH